MDIKYLAQCLVESKKKKNLDTIKHFCCFGS